MQNRQSEPAGDTRRRTKVRREVKNDDNQKYKLKGTPYGVPSFIKILFLMFCAKFTSLSDLK